MKGRMRKITGILLVFVLCIGTASQSGAVTIDEAEKKADQLESDKKKAEEEKKRPTSPHRQIGRAHV